MLSSSTIILIQNNNFCPVCSNVATGKCIVRKILFIVEKFVTIPRSQTLLLVSSRVEHCRKFVFQQRRGRVKFCSFAVSPYCRCSEFIQNVVYEFQDPSFCILNFRKCDKIRFPWFNICFQQYYFVQLVVHVILF